MIIKQSCWTQSVLTLGSPSDRSTTHIAEQSSDYTASGKVMCSVRIHQNESGYYDEAKDYRKNLGLAPLLQLDNPV